MRREDSIEFEIMEIRSNLLLRKMTHTFGQSILNLILDLMGNQCNCSMYVWCNLILFFLSQYQFGFVIMDELQFFSAHSEAAQPEDCCCIN